MVTYIFPSTCLRFLCNNKAAGFGSFCHSELSGFWCLTVKVITPVKPFFNIYYMGIIIDYPVCRLSIYKHVCKTISLNIQLLTPNLCQESIDLVAEVACDHENKFSLMMQIPISCENEFISIVLNYPWDCDPMHGFA